MRILVFSDIHNKLDAVRKLREKEENSFDAVRCNIRMKSSIQVVGLNGFEGAS